VGGAAFGAFKEQVIHGYIDSVATVLNAESQARNFSGVARAQSIRLANYYVGQTFQSEVNWLKGWVSQRFTWLDQNMPLLVTDIEQHGESISKLRPTRILFHRLSQSTIAYKRLATLIFRFGMAPDGKPIRLKLSTIRQEHLAIRGNVTYQEFITIQLNRVQVQ
jgi:hypothetical protein